jgi:2'-5' RNA ligase
VSGAARGRLFVALDLPGEVCQAAAGWARRARRASASMRLADVDMLHVTLCFLATRSLGEVPALAAALEDVAGWEPVEGLSLGAPLWLPPRRPRVLAVEVRDPLGGLGGLQQSVVRAVSAAIDWEPERRRFRPHVTVARMREGAAPRERELEPTPAVVFAGQAVTLYRSRLSRDGASYEALEGVELGAPTQP